MSANMLDQYERVWTGSRNPNGSGKSNINIKLDDIGENKELILKYLSPKERGDALILAALDKKELLEQTK